MMNNAAGDVINRRAAEVFAVQAGVDLHWYHAMDTHNRSLITGEASVINKLEKQDSGQMKHRLQKIPLVVGMPVAVNQNFDVAAGVVNSSYGFSRKIRYFLDEKGWQYLKSCIVELPGSDDVEMAHLPKHHLPSRFLDYLCVSIVSIAYIIMFIASIFMLFSCSFTHVSPFDPFTSSHIL